MSHELLLEAERLRREQGEASYIYLDCLSRIEARPKIWRTKEGRTFRDFLRETRHGPYERYQKFKETVAISKEYEERHPKMVANMGKRLVEALGFEATSQVLRLSEAGKHRDRAFQALIEAYKMGGSKARDRRPLSYQSATSILYDVLNIAKEPTKTARGPSLQKLREALLKAKRELASSLQIIAVLRKRLRDGKLDDSIPTVTN